MQDSGQIVDNDYKIFMLIPGATTRAELMMRIYNYARLLKVALLYTDTTGGSVCTERLDDLNNDCRVNLEDFL